jgi:hypothetical protein
MKSVLKITKNEEVPKEDGKTVFQVGDCTFETPEAYDQLYSHPSIQTRFCFIQSHCHPSIQILRLCFIQSHRIFTLRMQVHAGAASNSGQSALQFKLNPKPLLLGSRSSDRGIIACVCARIVRQQACSSGIDTGSSRGQRQRGSADEQDTAAAAAAGMRVYVMWLRSVCRYACYSFSAMLT